MALLVTGASQGIGRATSLTLAQAGARVIVAARNAEKLAGVVEEIRAAGGDALAVQMDVADAEQIKAGFRQGIDHFGRLDILVNNAAVARDALALRMKAEDWDVVLRTNLTGAHRFQTSKPCPPCCGRQLSRANIINVTSVVAETGNAGQSNYVAAKAGLIGLTRAIANEVASRNITVNAVAPGFVVSPMTDPLPQKVKDELLTRIPLGRMGQDAEVAAAIVFLASDEAAYISGHTLDVNGGMRMA